MNHSRSTPRFGTTAVATLLCGFGILASAFPPSNPPQTPTLSPLVVYFDDGPFLSEHFEAEGTTYIPLTELVRRMALPYTDATALGTFTVRGPNGTLVARNDSNTIAIDGSNTQLQHPVLREDGRWFVPVEFLTKGLGAITGARFRHTTGAPRILVGDVTATELDLNAVQTANATRLTIRSGVGVNLRVQQIREENKVILAFNLAPMNPAEEALDYRDALIRSIRFDDTDGRSKVVIETTPQVVNVRLVPTDENRTFFVEFIPESAPAETVAAVSASLEEDSRTSGGNIRVIVIDPGHGGLDSGTDAHGTLEKDVSLTLARLLRRRLQTQLDTTVILTRDADRELGGETRSAIANNSKADLLISLHVGFSSDPTESGASLFVVKQQPGDALTDRTDGNLFKSWYGTYRVHLESSREFGTILQQRLMEAIPGWQFPIREAPISVLTSADMPAILIELGNANNAANLLALRDEGFQGRFTQAVVEAIARFGNPGPDGFF